MSYCGLKLQTVPRMSRPGEVRLNARDRQLDTFVLPDLGFGLGCRLRGLPFPPLGFGLFLSRFDILAFPAS